MRAKKARETDSVQVQFVRVLLLQGYEEQFRKARARYTGLFIINGGRNSYDPVEILAKKLRKLNETNILVITILESQKLS